MSQRRPPPPLFQVGRDRRRARTVPLAEFNQGTGPQGVVCQRVADGPPAVPSREGVCDGCLARVWLSPSTQDLVPHMRAPEIMCLQCWMERLKQEKGT
jgi:hypothetical protein